MQYFLAYFPDQKTNFKVRKVVGELGRVFKDQSIDVRWSKPESFHVNVFFLGNDLNPIKLFFLKQRLKKISISPFTIQLEKANLGISRKYKELIYLSISKGGDELRDLVFKIRNELHIDDFNQFIPNLKIGRISKDLTEQEFKNLNQDVRNVNKVLNIKDIVFDSGQLCIVRNENEILEILHRF